jgi:hypothetical protein
LSEMNPAVVVGLRMVDRRMSRTRQRRRMLSARMISKPPDFRKDGRLFKWGNAIVKLLSNHFEHLEILFDFEQFDSSNKPTSIMK